MQIALFLELLYFLGQFFVRLSQLSELEAGDVELILRLRPILLQFTIFFL